MSKTIIQIGIADARDKMRDFILKNPNDYMIHLVEPNIHSTPKIEEAYAFTKNKKIYTFAIAPFDGWLDIYFHDYEGGNSQHASANLHHLRSHGHSKIISQKTECYTINSFLKKFSLENDRIEYLYIDTEGYDCDILLATDFQNLKIKNIVFETRHTEGPFSSNGPKMIETLEYLKSFGYEPNATHHFTSDAEMNLTLTKKDEQ